MTCLTNDIFVPIVVCVWSCGEENQFYIFRILKMEQNIHVISIKYFKSFQTL